MTASSRLPVDGSLVAFQHSRDVDVFYVTIERLSDNLDHGCFMIRDPAIAVRLPWDVEPVCARHLPPNGVGAHVGRESTCIDSQDVQCGDPKGCERVNEAVEV